LGFLGEQERGQDWWTLLLTSRRRKIRRRVKGGEQIKFSQKERKESPTNFDRSVDG